MSRDDVVVVLGSGASYDAGLPIGPELNDRLVSHFDGTIAGFRELYCGLLMLDPRVRGNYERLEHWLVEIQYTTQIFSLLGLDFRRSSDAAGAAGSRIHRFVVDALSQPLSDPSYLAHLDQLTPGRRLKAFSLNYDVAVETACEVSGISCTTGFDPLTGQWRPLLFEDQTAGIALYKLHGSLNWFEVIDFERADDDPDADLDALPPVVVQEAPEWECSFQHPKRSELPRLILGPATKVQTDDPYFHLLTVFHEALKRTRVCVTIGYAWKDPHITDRIDWHRRAGMVILDVNPKQAPFFLGGVDGSDGLGLTGYRNYVRLELRPTEGLTVRHALTTGLVHEEVRRLFR